MAGGKGGCGRMVSIERKNVRERLWVSRPQTFTPERHPGQTWKNYCPV